MYLAFTPNIHQKSKILFTGRSDDFNKLFSLIIEGSCIALYGERRSGKTLSLEMLKGIVNDEINNTGIIKSLNYQMIDKTFIDHIINWKNQLSNYDAIYISLMGIRSEQDFLYSLLNSINKQKISCFSNLVQKLTDNESVIILSNLLDNLQSKLFQNQKKLIFLIDEMEILAEFEDGSVLAELFCDRNRYNNIIFVHAGSYQWNQSVSSPGSLFTHLEPYYLRGINEDDAVSFLLNPIKNQDLRKIIFQMSGGKPLYIQLIGKYLLDNSISLENLTNRLSTKKTNRINGSKKNLEEMLLKNDSLYIQIEQNIYNERRLDEDSKKIIATLSYNPNVSIQWLAENLKLNTEEIRNKVGNLVRFGTIYEINDKYKIIGEFIERFGKEIRNDPVNRYSSLPPTSTKDKILWFFRWLMMLGMFYAAFRLFRYSNPKNISRNLVFDPLYITLSHPESLENDEQGKIKLQFKNTSSIKLTSLEILFESSEIAYDNNQSNLINIKELKPNESFSSEINYLVHPGNTETLESQLTYRNKKSSFRMVRRKVALKKYGTTISIFISALAALFPGKSWLSVLARLKQVLPARNTSQIEKTKE
ncbi:MAG: hypothetical protein AAFQ80_01165 [Cyanobacteria bacterium J06621_8]